MVQEVQFKVQGLKKLQSQFAQKDSRLIGRELKKQIKRGLLSFVGRVQAERLSGRPGLMVRTGTLRRSFKAEVQGNKLENIVGIAGTPIFWASVHETGKTIVAKNPTGLLTIPFRAPGAAFSAEVVSFRRVPQVVIPARLGFFDTYKKHLPIIEKLMGLALKEL